LRGKGDNFFCDREAERFLRGLNIKVVEVEGGHIWNKNMEIKILEAVSGRLA